MIATKSLLYRLSKIKLVILQNTHYCRQASENYFTKYLHLYFWYVCLQKIYQKLWKIKKLQSPLISNPVIDAFYERALALGAYGGKLCGAGSSGFFLLAANQDTIQKLKYEFDKMGVVNFSWDFVGNQVKEVF